MFAPARCAAVFAVLSAVAVSAQTATTPANQKYMFVETVIRLDARTAYEGTLKAYCAAIVKGGARECNVYSTALFGNAGSFVIVVPFDKYAHYDEGTFFSKGASSEEQKRIMTDRAKAEISVDGSSINFIAGLSINSDKTPRYLHVTEIHVRPGMQQGFYDDVEKILLPAAKKAGLADYWTFKTLQGNNPDRMFSIIPIEHYADLDKGNPLFAAMGKENFATFQQHTATYTEKVSYSIVEHRKELSASAAK